MKKIMDKLSHYYDRIHCLDKYGQFLKNGIYESDYSGTVFFLRSVANREHGFTVQSSIGRNQRNIIKKILSNCLRKQIQGQEKKFYGELIIRCTSGNEAKIFDYSSGKVMTIIEDSARMEEIIHKRCLWSQYFPVPEYEYDMEKGTIVEALIKKEPHNPQKACPQIIQDYYSYFKSIQMKQSNTQDFTQKENRFGAFCDAFELRQYKERIEMIHGTLPYCLTHGDLNPMNVLCQSGNSVYIDFEYVKERIFFSDIFQYMFSCIDLLDNWIPFKSYFDGVYDSILKEMFSAIGITYHTELKNIYVFCFLFEYWKDYYGKPMEKDQINHFKEILHSIKGEYQV